MMKNLLIPVGNRFVAAGALWAPYSKSKPTQKLRAIAEENAYSLFIDLKLKKKPAFFGLIPSQDVPARKILSLMQLLYLTADGKAAGIVVKNGDWFCICVVNDGMPIKDDIYTNQTDAVEEIIDLGKKLGFKPILNFENDYGLRTEDSLLPLLVSQVGKKATSFKDVPVSQTKSLVLTFIAVAILGFIWNEHRNSVREEELRRQNELARNDPVPKYLTALRVNTPTYALPDNVVRKMFGSIQSIVADPLGWELKTISCGINYECVAEFSRTDGNKHDLLAANPQLDFNSLTDTNLNIAKGVLKFEQENFQFQPYTKNFERFLKEDFEVKGQDWLTAKIAIGMQTPVLWPNVNGVEKNFRHPAAIHSGNIEISNVPLFLADDFLISKPKNMFVRSFILETKIPTFLSKEEKAVINFKGVYHVSSN